MLNRLHITSFRRRYANEVTSTFTHIDAVKQPGHLQYAKLSTTKLKKTSSPNLRDTCMYR